MTKTNSSFLAVNFILKPLECDVCNESFVDDCSLYNHVRFAHSTENVECNDCGKYFRSEKGLASHQMSAHNTDPSSQNRHKCTVCGKCYRDKQGLKEHLVTHMSVRYFYYSLLSSAVNSLLVVSNSDLVFRKSHFHVINVIEHTIVTLALNNTSCLIFTLMPWTAMNVLTVG